LYDTKLRLFPGTDQLVQIRSQNVDVYNLTLHSHLYRVLTPSGANFLDFGSVIINAPTIRTIHFENLTESTLDLELTASQPEDVELYVKVEDATPRLSGKARGGAGEGRLVSDESSGGSGAGGELKERFMETLRELSAREPAPGGGVAKGKGKTRERSVGKEEEGKKVNVALAVASALKRGGRGRPVTVSITFLKMDNKLIMFI
jgi:hypothetical protein